VNRDVWFLEGKRARFGALRPMPQLAVREADRLLWEPMLEWANEQSGDGLAEAG
jgi:hypothetical protein